MSNLKKGKKTGNTGWIQLVLTLYIYQKANHPISHVWNPTQKTGMLLIGLNEHLSEDLKSGSVLNVNGI